MEIFLYALIFFIIPVISFCLFKRLVVSYLLASVCGAIVVVARMLYLEANASNREFDLVFFLSVFIWAAIVFLLYLPYLALAKFIKNRLSKNKV
jgi:hypothetical protein